MNVNDTEVVRAIMQSHNYVCADKSDVVRSACVVCDCMGVQADVHLLMTCSIRDRAEERIWTRLNMLRKVQRRRPLVIGVLGCMAERLKSRLLDGGIVDVVAGPDAYRDLPRLLAHHQLTDEAARECRRTVAVYLSNDLQ
jgi:tRNA-2-methylthio-N6-dimethylallyladenosine synthase